MNINQEKENLYAIMLNITERLNYLNKLEGTEVVQPTKPEVKPVPAQPIKTETITVMDKPSKKASKMDFTATSNKKKLEVVKPRRKRSRKQLNTQKVMATLTEVLKEAEDQMELKKLHQETQAKYGKRIGFTNFQNNLLPRAMKQDKAIVRATRGFYKYNG
jgi:hypothetical protein